MTMIQTMRSNSFRMPDLEYHCKECEELLGQRFAQVHKWLDELMYDKNIKLRYRTRHRKFRHNREGIEKVRKMWGELAAKAAEIHIRTDLRSCGYPDSKPIPRNREEYEESGLW